MSVSNVKFKVSSALKNLIGRELITDVNVAVFELVKNSFDARSNNVNLTFDLDKKEIVISDDGVGMSEDDIINKWLFIGYSEKKNVKDGSVSGNKGIGRFSCDRLGSKLILTSNKEGCSNKIFIDWDLFELDQNNEIQEKNFLLETSSSLNKNGTTLIISGLRDDWNNNKIDKAISILKRLLSPNSYDIKCNLNVFIIKDKITTEYRAIKNDVFAYMEEKSVYVECKVLNDNIETKLFDRGKIIVSNISKNSYALSDVYIRAYFMSANAKTIFKKKTGINKKDYGDLFIYRNHFRVYPYGESTYDTFGLNLRKTQGYNRYIGPRELLGWIDVIDKENHFSEPTSRDNGFTQNIYLEQLKEMYFEYVQRPLERYVQIINYGNIDILAYSNVSTDIISDALSDVFNFKNSTDKFINKEVLEQASPDQQINAIISNNLLSNTEKKKIARELREKFSRQNNEINKLKKDIVNQENINEKLEKEISVKNLFINKARPERQNILEHDLNVVIRRLRKIASDLLKLNDAKINEKISDILWCANRTDAIRKICLRTGNLTLSDDIVNVGKFYEEYIEISHPEITTQIFINELFEIKINLFDLITIFDNVHSNAFAFDASYLKIFIFNDRIQFVSDTLKKAKNADFKRVFDFGYSTREKGTGMGLFIVKQICLNANLGIKVVDLQNEDLFCLEIFKL